MSGKNTLGIIVAILAILLLLAGIWGFSNNSAKNKLMVENETLSSELSDIRRLKDNLKTEVDSLQSAYNTLTEENESLQDSLVDSKSAVNNLSNSVRRLRIANKNLKSENDTQTGNLRDQIQGLLNDKSSLEVSIQSLQAQNDSLRSVAGILEENLDKAKEENKGLANLNQTMQDELARLTLANFKASAFRVEVEKNKPKATAKSKRARRIRVSFDLTNVPDKYRGVRPLFLSITNEKGTPIKADNPIQAKVSVNGQSTDVIAVETKEVNIVDNQRLSFSHDLSERLKSGYYRVVLYTDIGVLGASSFRLR